MRSLGSTAFSRRRFLASLGATSLGGILAAACGPATPAAPSKPAEPGQTAAGPAAARPPAAAGQTKIAMWHGWTQQERIDMLNQAVADFAKERPSTTVETEVVAWAKQEAKWVAAHAAGVMPEVIMTRYEESYPMFEAGAIDAVDHLIKDLGGEAAFIQAPLEQVKFQGKYIGVPWYTFSRILYYRKDLLDEKGLKAPASWQELEQASVALHSPSGRNGFAVALAEATPVRQFLAFYLRANGTEFFDDKGDVILNSPEGVEAVQAAAELARKAGPANVTGWKDDDPTQAFLTDKAVFHLNWPAMLQWIVLQKPELVGKVDVMNFPKNRVEPNPLGFSAVFVRGVGSKIPEETDAFIKFLMREENQIAGLHALAGIQPVTHAVAASPKFWQNNVLNTMKPLMEKHIQFSSTAHREGMLNSRLPSNSIALNSPVLVDMMGTILLQNTPADRAVADAAKKLQAIVDEQKKR